MREFIEIIEKCLFSKQASANNINQKEKAKLLEIDQQIKKCRDQINELFFVFLQFKNIREGNEYVYD